MSRGLTCDNRLRLKWEEEFVAHGRAFGRQGVWSKDQSRQPGSPRGVPDAACLTRYLAGTPPIKPYHFINVFVRDLEGDVGDDEDDAESRGREAVATSPTPSTHITLYHRAPSHFKTSLTILTSPKSLPHVDDFDSSLFEYYFRRLCPLTSPSRRATSPFVDLILPLFATGGQDFVLQSVMALSARHRSLTDSRWTRRALSHKGRALAALRQRLGPTGTTMNAIADPQVPVAMMFLCLDEILDNCDHRWVIHLRACQDWLRRRKQFPSVASDSERTLVSFAERFFAFQDVISRTACGSSPHFGLEYWQSLERGADSQGWTGCSPAMASIIFRITELGRARGRSELDADEFERQAGLMEEELESLDYADQVQDFEDMESDAVMRSSFELMRESVRLYHHCLLHDALPSMPFVTHTVTRILQRTRRLLEAGLTSGLAFPLFVAAVELDPPNDELTFDNGERGSGRRLVLEILQTLAGASLFNVGKTRAVIRSIWTMRDLGLNHEQTMHWQNDWNTYVNPYSSNISLA